MKPKNPQDKKRIEYERNHYVIAEYPHAFRKNWPRKKVRANREFRRKADEVVNDLRHLSASDAVDVAETLSVTRERVLKSISKQRLRKWSVVSLHERVQRTLEDRVRHKARLFFRMSYESDTHRASFVKYLPSVIENESAYFMPLAMFFDELLNQYVPWQIRDREWLMEFFLEEPEWEQRLRSWVEMMKENHGGS